MKPKAGPSGGAYNEEDWNDEVDENAQGADAYRYSKVMQHALMVAHHTEMLIPLFRLKEQWYCITVRDPVTSVFKVLACIC